MNHPYVQANAVEREHLLSLINRLTDDELSQPLAAGWTVAGVFAHLAFWDLRALTLLKKWKQNGIGPSPIDTDIVNEAMREHCIAISPRAATRLAISTASAIDEAIELLDAPMFTEVETNGSTVHLNRASHRQEHLSQIEQALGISTK